MTILFLSHLNDCNCEEKKGSYGTSLDPLEIYIELNDLNVPLELRRDKVDNLMPTIEEGKVVEEFRSRNDARMVSEISRYPSDCDHDKKIRIDCAHNLKYSYMIDFAVLEDMDAYRDEGMGDVIFGEPFLREVGINARRFEGIITIYNGNEEVTYQIVRSHPRFKCHTNKQCNKIPPLLKHEHYALWEVIEFGDSYEAPAKNPTTGSASDGTGKKKGRTVTLTADDMQKRKNDVKARTTLLLSLPDEHQLQFTTKKTKKNLLKQHYGNFKVEGLDTLEKTFNILQRNRSDLDTMSLDDLCNHLKVYESKVQKHTKPNFQNMAFISSAKHSSENEEINIASVSTASTNVSTASVNIGVASISQDTACAYIASQSSGSQIKFEDINQIDKDDMEEMDIK
uniref:Uncharacterized protein n=1 Tax=Tanacetum cinerariifolium TaxID=118510 RepID=A0A699HMA1_TANCI|nr:hypothetical protein [Tanacetum cinerariifolium]